MGEPLIKVVVTSPRCLKHVGFAKAAAKKLIESARGVTDAISKAYTVDDGTVTVLIKAFRERGGWTAKALLTTGAVRRFFEHVDVESDRLTMVPGYEYAIADQVRYIRPEDHFTGEVPLLLPVRTSILYVQHLITRRQWGLAWALLNTSFNYGSAYLRNGWESSEDGVGFLLVDTDYIVVDPESFSAEDLEAVQAFTEYLEPWKASFSRASASSLIDVPADQPPPSLGETETVSVALNRVVMPNTAMYTAGTVPGPRTHVRWGLATEPIDFLHDGRYSFLYAKVTTTGTYETSYFSSALTTSKGYGPWYQQASEATRVDFVEAVYERTPSGYSLIETVALGTRAIGAWANKSSGYPGDARDQTADDWVNPPYWFSYDGVNITTSIPPPQYPVTLAVNDPDRGVHELGTVNLSVPPWQEFYVVGSTPVYYYGHISAVTVCGTTADLGDGLPRYVAPTFFSENPWLNGWGSPPAFTPSQDTSQWGWPQFVERFEDPVTGYSFQFDAGAGDLVITDAEQVDLFRMRVSRYSPAIKSGEYRIAPSHANSSTHWTEVVDGSPVQRWTERSDATLYQVTKEDVPYALPLPPFPRIAPTVTDRPWGWDVPRLAYSPITGQFLVFRQKSDVTTDQITALLEEWEQANESDAEEGVAQRIKDAREAIVEAFDIFHEGGMHSQMLIPAARINGTLLVLE